MHETHFVVQLKLNFKLNNKYMGFYPNALILLFCNIDGTGVVQVQYCTLTVTLGAKGRVKKIGGIFH